MSALLSLLQDLVRIPSVNPSCAEPGEPGGEGRLVDFLEDWCRRQGLATLRQPTPCGRDNLLVIVPGSRGPSLLFEAHLDTVGSQGYAGDPFSGDLREGRVWGLGACDCKASMAAMLLAARRAAGERLVGGCLVALVVDEESLFTGINTLLRQPLPLPVQGAVVGEPTGLDVIDQHCGAVRLRFTVHGKAAHSSCPEQGENAIYRACRLVQAFERYHQSLQPATAASEGPVRTCAVTVIEGGQAINVIPNHCVLCVDRRVRPDEQVGEVQRELEAVAGEAAGGGFPWEVEVILVDPPLPRREPSPLADLCEQAVREVRGACTRRWANYSTDASKLAEAGMETVVLGPGEVAQAHTKEEWVEVEQVEQAEEVYWRLLLAIGGRHA